jgi:Tol biopolymer transport system component
MCIRPDGSKSGGKCLNAQISGDGRRVVFESYATDLGPGNDNGKTHVYLYDRVANAVSRLSVTVTGMPGNGSSRNPSISPDGRYVVFESTASNLVETDTNGASDVFLKDLSTGSLSRLSLTASGGQSNGPSVRATVSADGKWVAYESTASNLTWEGVGGLFLVGPLDH